MMEHPHPRPLPSPVSSSHGATLGWSPSPAGVAQTQTTSSPSPKFPVAEGPRQAKWMRPGQERRRDAGRSSSAPLPTQQSSLPAASSSLTVSSSSSSFSSSSTSVRALVVSYNRLSGSTSSRHVRNDQDDTMAEPAVAPPRSDMDKSYAEAVVENLPDDKHGTREANG